MNGGDKYPMVTTAQQDLYNFQPPFPLAHSIHAIGIKVVNLITVQIFCKQFETNNRVADGEFSGYGWFMIANIGTNTPGLPYVFIDVARGYNVPSNAPRSSMQFMSIDPTVIPFVFSFIMTLPDGQYKYTLELDVSSSIQSGYAQYTANSQHKSPLQFSSITAIATATIPNIMNVMNNRSYTHYDNSNNEKETYPQLIIDALNTSDGKQVSEIRIEVTDVYTYKLCNECLQVKKICAVTTSHFFIYAPDFANVILGCGCTFYDKIYSIVDNMYLYDTIVIYSIIKYVLATLIYGKLDIHFLDRCFNKQFLSDLKHSRFSDFLFLFTVPNPPEYDFTQTYKYFICDCCRDCCRDYCCDRCCDRCCCEDRGHKKKCEKYRKYESKNKK